MIRTYSNESIQKTFDWCAVALHDPVYLKAAQDQRVNLSRGNDKIGNTLNVSLPPVATCQHCESCKGNCYALKLFLKFSYETKNGKLNPWLLNYVILKTNQQKYFNDIALSIKENMPLFFRWHVSGDIVSVDYFDNMLKIARQFPNTKFLAMTKSYEVINKYIEKVGARTWLEIKPANFNLFFSRWYDTKCLNAYSVPENHVLFNDSRATTTDKKVFVCPGNCAICQYNKTGCFYSGKKSPVVGFMPH